MLEHAQLHPPVMLRGMLNRKCTIYSAKKPFWEMWSPYKPVFHRYLPIGCAYSTYRSLELEIWRFSCRQRRRRQMTLPLAHARGVTNSSVSKEFRKVLKLVQGCYQHEEQPNNMHIAGDLLRFLGSTTFWSYSLLSLFAPCTVQTMGHQGSPDNLQYLSSG